MEKCGTDIFVDIAAIITLLFVKSYDNIINKL